MPSLIIKPTRIEGSGTKPIVIDEYIGRINSAHDAVSVAYLHCPGGWSEPGQTPEFDEFTVVLRGLLRVAHRSGFVDVRAGQAVITNRGEWVQYSTPEAEGADYVAVCLPAFSMEMAHRDNVPASQSPTT
jgi:mannose-6-phosphate isomerase-like protein (cupin superfamily)